MKKIYSVIFILLAFILTIGCFTGFYAYARADEIEHFHVKSKSACLLDYKTNTIIYSKNEFEHLPIASMCKIMTLLICFDALDEGHISLEENVLVSENASGMGGSQVFLESNAEYPVGELIKGIVVASANDACVAMAEKICGSEELFVDKMNEKASELQMKNTVFANCTGLPRLGQYSCARDVATMFSKLLTHEDYFKFSRIWTDIISHPHDRKTEISNTNKLIRFYKGCDSGKTGFTSEAGHCVAASAVRNDMRLISVVIHADNSKERFNDASNMFNYGFANYTNKVVLNKETPLNFDIKICGGKKDKLEVVPERSMYIFCKKNEKRAFELVYEPIDKIFAPINKGDNVGVVRAYENGVEFDCVNLLANETISQRTYFDVINKIGQKWGII